MNYNTVNNSRAVRDAAQSFLEQHLPSCIPAGLVSKFSTTFARRLMADFAFEDASGSYYFIDFKTHNLGTKFNMSILLL